MHPNPAFRGATRAQNVAFARDRGFGILAIGTGTGAAPLMSHVPFLLSPDGASAGLHLVRSNPIARELAAGPRAARIAVSGPDGYVSPDWYGVAAQVPTWNYVAVHLTGTIELRPAAELRDLLDRQSAFFEDRLAPKPPWMPDKMPAEDLDRMMRAIVPARFAVTEIDATWKLNQNKDPAARRGAATALEDAGFGAETARLAALMRDA